MVSRCGWQLWAAKGLRNSIDAARRASGGGWGAAPEHREDAVQRAATSSHAHVRWQRVHAALCMRISASHVPVDYAASWRSDG